jgi:glycolate oxidase FAD binding subunit
MSEIDALAAGMQQDIPGVQVITSAKTLQSYAIDGVLPSLVISPATVEQTSQVVAFANRHGLTVLARGGGSHLHLGGIPERVDLILETRQLTRLLEHEAPDLTCHVEAGITLADLQAQLAPKGQWLALDPPGTTQTTIGGLLASNASGPKRLRYGTARDLLIGLRVVQADGEIARSGGKVVKNVAGYDLNKLYIGSLGTLGIIVEANFKLQPLPSAERTLMLHYPGAADAMQTVMAILGSVLSPSAMELIDPGAASDMSDLSGMNLPTNGYTLAINFEGGTATIDRHIDETRLLARKHGALIGDELNGSEQERFWEMVRASIQGTVRCKVSMLPSSITSYLETTERVCRTHDLEAAIIAHAGNGIVFIELRPSDAIPRLVGAILELRQQAQQTHGHLVVERCPTALKQHIPVWGEPGGNFFLMQRLKQQFDPKGIFVRGRFVRAL